MSTVDRPGDHRSARPYPRSTAKTPIKQTRRFIQLAGSTALPSLQSLGQPVKHSSPSMANLGRHPFMNAPTTMIFAARPVLGQSQPAIEKVNTSDRKEHPSRLPERFKIIRKIHQKACPNGGLSVSVRTAIVALLVPRLSGLASSRPFGNTPSRITRFSIEMKPWSHVRQRDKNLQRASRKYAPHDGRPEALKPATVPFEDAQNSPAQTALLSNRSWTASAREIERIAELRHCDPQPY